MTASAIVHNLTRLTRLQGVLRSLRKDWHPHSSHMLFGVIHHIANRAPTLGLSQHCIPPEDGECLLSRVLFHSLMPAKFKAVHCSNSRAQRHGRWTCDWQCGTGLLKAAGHQSFGFGVAYCKLVHAGPPT